MKTIHKLILVVFLTGALFAAEWAIPRSTAEEGPRTYFFDRLGDLALIGIEKELYIERLDGSERRKITSSPDVSELDAFFGYGGRYVIYKAEKKQSAFDKKPSCKYNYFMQPIDENDLKKKEIDEFVYRDFKKKRIIERNSTQ